MVGAVILFVLALVCGIVGLLSWLWAETDGEAMRGVLFLVIAGVSLSGALVIDGIRFYAGRIIHQFEWIIKRSNYLGGNIQREESSGALGSQPLHRFHIIGKDHGTGLDTELVVQAIDQTSALRTGEKAGIDVRRVERID